MAMRHPQRLAAGSDAGGDEPERDPPPAPLLRCAVATAVVAAWVLLGFLLPLDPNTYLLLGIPITILFQVLVARQPLRALWLRSAPERSGGASRVLVFLALTVVPVLTMLQGLQARNWPVAAYGAVAVVGALGAAYALAAMDRATVRQLGGCIATAGLIGSAVFVLAMIQRRGLAPPPDPAASALLFGFSLLQYVAAVFVIEEVFFRGALDSYVHRWAAGTGWLSAVFASAVWGLWHLPLSFPVQGWVSIPLALLVHVPIGVPLSIYWRRSGNLAVPGITHALIDAVRNALA